MRVFGICLPVYSLRVFPVDSIMEQLMTTTALQNVLHDSGRNFKKNVHLPSGTRSVVWCLCAQHCHQREGYEDFRYTDHFSNSKRSCFFTWLVSNMYISLHDERRFGKEGFGDIIHEVDSSRVTGSMNSRIEFLNDVRSSGTRTPTIWISWSRRNL